MSKKVHVKPSLYAFYYEALKVCALKYGYNLVLHGSMARDLDLIAIPWQEVVGETQEMINEFAEIIGGYELKEAYDVTHHGRIRYVININRTGKWDGDEYIEAQYYLDISVMPTLKKES